MWRWLVGIALLTVIITSCSGPPPEPAASQLRTTTVPAAGTQPEAGGTTTASQAKPKHGIVVASEDDGTIEIGMIDPTDGSYSTENNFNVGDFAKGPNEPDVTTAVGFSMVVAPDRTRVMAQRKVNGDFHTGWITAAGDFVDVTAPNLGQRSDFSGAISSFGVGFDRQGNFHYGVDKGDSTEIWSLPAGQTTSPTLVATVGLLTVYRFDADGALQFALDDTCDGFAAYSWMGDWYLSTDGTQIYRGPRIPAVGPCGGEGSPLLPETNTATVADPVASPDLSEVAIIYTNSDTTKSIYIISADGSGEPRKINTVQWPSEQAHLVGWV